MPHSTTDLGTPARELLEANTVQGDGVVYTAPSPPHYPDMWNWDSRLIARVWLAIEPERGLRELETLFDVVGEDGALPVRTRVAPTGGHGKRLGLRHRLERRGAHLLHKAAPLTQPPVAVLDAAMDATAEDDRLRPLVEAETRHLSWLRRERADADGLVRIIHPWESGMDAKPSYDLVHKMDGRTVARAAWALQGRLVLSGLRHRWDPDRMQRRGRFVVKDVLFNSIYVDNLRTTADAHRRLGGPARAARLDAWADQTERSVVEHMWDEDRGFFYDVGPDDERLMVRTVAGFVPLLLEGVPNDVVDRLVQEHLLDEDAFWAPWPIPSVAMDEPSYEPRRSWPLWRGPTWVNTNWLAWTGLRRRGYSEVADELARRTREMVSLEGFQEFYDPRTGDGLRPRTAGFGWSTLAALMANG